MSLKSIVQSKDKYVTGLLNSFDKLWETMTPDLQAGLTTLFKTNSFTQDAIQSVFVENGFDDLVGETAKKFQRMVGFSRDLSKEVGYKFLLTDENIQLFDLMNEFNVETLLTTKAQIVNDLKRFAIEAKLEGRTLAELRLGNEAIFENMGRRLNTEIFTGIRRYDSALSMVSMKNGGIELFQYLGPNDNVTRDDCAGTHADSRQETGWTAAEVEASATPFIDRGGWNCRDIWVAFV